MDRPYWGETRSHPFYVKIVKNNHLKNWQEDRPDDRFKKLFPWPIKPWKKDGKNIIVCPPSNAMKEFFNADNWLVQLIEIFKNFPDTQFHWVDDYSNENKLQIKNVKGINYKTLDKVCQGLV